MKKDIKDLNNNFIAMSDFHINLPIIFKKLPIKILITFWTQIFILFLIFCIQMKPLQNYYYHS